MDQDAITHHITSTYDGVETSTAMGYLFFFYSSNRKMPFATLATEDNEYDRVSQLDRPSVYRLNIGVRKETYRSLFGQPPSRTGAEGIVETGHDFTTLDQLMPHPVYAPQSWVCILNPTTETLEQTVRPLLAEAYHLALQRASKARDADRI